MDVVGAIVVGLLLGGVGYWVARNGGHVFAGQREQYFGRPFRITAVDVWASRFPGAAFVAGGIATVVFGITTAA